MLELEHIQTTSYSFRFGSVLLRHPDYDHIVVHGVHPSYVKSGTFRPVDKSNTTQAILTQFSGP